MRDLLNLVHNEYDGCLASHVARLLPLSFEPLSRRGDGVIRAYEVMEDPRPCKGLGDHRCLARLARPDDNLDIRIVPLDNPACDGVNLTSLEHMPSPGLFHAKNLLLIILSKFANRNE